MLGMASFMFRSANKELILNLTTKEVDQKIPKEIFDSSNNDVKELLEQIDDKLTLKDFIQKVTSISSNHARNGKISDEYMSHNQIIAFYLEWVLNVLCVNHNHKVTRV